MRKYNRSDQEVDRVLDWAADRIDNGTVYTGMSYEEGVRDAISWLTGEDDTAPDAE